MATKKDKPMHPDEKLRDAIDKFREGMIEKDKTSRETNRGSAPTNGYSKHDSENLYR